MMKLKYFLSFLVFLVPFQMLLVGSSKIPDDGSHLGNKDADLSKVENPRWCKATRTFYKKLYCCECVRLWDETVCLQNCLLAGIDFFTPGAFDGCGLADKNPCWYKLLCLICNLLGGKDRCNRYCSRI